MLNNFQLANLCAALILTVSYTSTTFAIEQRCKQSDVLNTESLIDLALACNPQQGAISARWQSSQLNEKVMSRWEDPKLSVALAPKTLDDELLDEGYIVELSQSIPWMGTTKAKKRLATQQSTVWESKNRQNKISLARDIRMQVANWQYHHNLLDINKENQQLWKEFSAIIETKYSVGTQSKSAVLQAEHERHFLMQEEIELSAQFERINSELRRLLAFPITFNFNSLANEDIDLVNADRIEILFSSLEQQPLIQEINAQQQENKQQLILEKKDRYPNFSLMSRYNTLMENENQRWLVGVGLNLPIDIGKRRSKEQSLQAEQLALQLDYQNLQLMLREKLYQDYSLWKQSKKIHQLFVNEMLPVAQESIATAKDEYQSGQGDFLTLLNAQRQLLSTQKKVEASRRDQRMQFAQLTFTAGFIHKSDWDNLGVDHE